MYTEALAFRGVESREHEGGTLIAFARVRLKTASAAGVGPPPISQRGLTASGRSPGFLHRWAVSTCWLVCVVSGQSCPLSGCWCPAPSLAVRRRGARLTVPRSPALGPSVWCDLPALREQEKQDWFGGVPSEWTWETTFSVQHQVSSTTVTIPFE